MGSRSVAFGLVLGVLWAPATGVQAEDPPAHAAVHHTATNLVDQIALVIDALKASRQLERAQQERDAEAEDEARDALRAADRGVVPAARTLYMLLKGSFGVERPDAAELSSENRQVYLQLKPRHVGGYLRCEVRF